jgi:hypothetical protein
MTNCPICGKKVEDDPALQKLHLIKCVINHTIPTIESFIPQTETKHTISTLISKIFYETKKNLKTHPPRFYEDLNFPRFLDAVEKTITYICETDPHYRGWMAYFLLATMDIMNYEYERFPWKRYYMQNKIKGISIHDPLAKPKLFLYYLTEHGIIFHAKG